MNTAPPGRCWGFTLIELLVVLLVAGIVLVVLVPALNTAREKERRAQCADNLRQIGLALAAYASDHAGHLPTAYMNNDGWSSQRATWDRALAPAYVPVRNLVCPSDMARRDDGELPRSYAIFVGTGSSPWRFFITGSRLPCRWLKDPTNTVVVVERAQAENLRNRENSSFINQPDAVRSPHVHNAPAAGNYLFLDGHVEWAEQVASNRFPAPPPAATGFVVCP